jgi:two-component system, cell cycle response regulator DivK
MRIDVSADQARGELSPIEALARPDVPPPRTILVVDDEPTNIDLIRWLIEDAGLPVRVLTAATGREAIQQARAERPDLILLDLKMPDVDGWETARSLRADPATAAVRIVALTAQAMPGDRDTALAAGCDDYLTKPLDVRAVLAVIRDALA